MNQMDNTVTKAELATLLEVVEASRKLLRRSARLYAVPQVQAERERLHVARRTVHKLHKLFKQGQLQEQRETAGGAGVAKNRRCNLMTQEAQEQRETAGGAGA